MEYAPIEIDMPTTYPGLKAAEQIAACRVPV
jgi:hypothetical protein